MLAKLLEKIMSLAVLVALAWAGWYGYTHWIVATPDSGAPPEVSRFNCKQALAMLAEDQACRSSEACDMTLDELADMKQREADIEEHCN